MRRASRNPTVLIVTAVAVMAAAGIWAANGGLGPSADDGQPSVAGSPVVARIAVDDSPRQPVLAADGLWVVGERALYRIDPSSNRLVATVPVGTLVAAPAAVALAAGVAWVPSGASSSLWRVDRAANRVDGRIGLGRRLLGPVGVAARDDTVWVSCCAFQHGPRPAGMLLRVDTRRNRVVERIPIVDGPLAVTAGAGAVWVATARGGVLRVDPASNRVVGRVFLAAGSRIEAITPRRAGSGRSTPATTTSCDWIPAAAGSAWRSPRRSHEAWASATPGPG
jgi:hypothetical protein